MLPLGLGHNIKLLLTTFQVCWAALSVYVVTLPWYVAMWPDLNFLLWTNQTQSTSQLLQAKEDKHEE